MPDGTILTFDVDWAPDCALEAVVGSLTKAGVRSTWFVTHASTIVDRMRARPDLFELGIHPNFLAASTHGTTLESVVDHTLAIVPEAVSTRSHSVFQSGRLLEVLVRKGLRIDSSVLLPRASGLQPVRYNQFGGCLWRIPFVWADDYELGQERPEWSCDWLGATDGVKVLAFHPLHVFLNSGSWSHYNRLKESAHDLTSLRETDLLPFRCDGAGAATALDEVIARVASVGGGQRLVDLVPPGGGA